jgi:hypothetical protein
LVKIGWSASATSASTSGQKLVPSHGTRVASSQNSTIKPNEGIARPMLTTALASASARRR